MYRVMIQGIIGKLTEQAISGKPGKGFPTDLLKAVVRKLAMLEAAKTLDDLRVPPANHLEALKGDRAGQHSIRVNDQWRLCFVWTDKGPDRVELVDYH